MHTKKNLRD
jgi:hypothetical protein